MNEVHIRAAADLRKMVLLNHLCPGWSLLLLLIINVSIAQGCTAAVSPSRMKNSPLFSSTPTAATQLIPQPQKESFSTPATSTTLVPTLTATEPTLSSEEKNNYILDLLNKTNACTFPCFWNITPGDTDWSQAWSFLSTFTNNEDDFLVTFDNGLIHELEYQPLQGENSTTIGLNIFEQNGAIDFLTSSIVSSNFDAILPKYTLKELLIRYGIPSRIQIHLLKSDQKGDSPSILRYQMWYFYDKKGFVFSYEGGAKKVNNNYLVCPSQPGYFSLMGNIPQYSKFNSLRFYIQSSENQRSLEELINKAASMYISKQIPFTLSSTEAFDASVDEFFNQISHEKADLPACFQTPISLWNP